jgi:hypothetical protein
MAQSGLLGSKAYPARVTEDVFMTELCLPARLRAATALDLAA